MNEITYSFNLLLKNGNLGDQFASGSKSANQSVAKLIRNVQTISTAAAGVALVFSDIATPGFMVFQNLDATNYVDIGIQVVGVFYPAIRIKAGEIQLTRYSPGAASLPYARANGASIELFYICYED
jgi:hypothetical protein